MQLKDQDTIGIIGREFQISESNEKKNEMESNRIDWNAIA